MGITEGPLPYYVEGTAAWLQVENVYYVDKKAYAYCIVPEALISAVGYDLPSGYANISLGDTTVISEVTPENFFT